MSFRKLKTICKRDFLYTKWRWRWSNSITRRNSDITR